MLPVSPIDISENHMTQSSKHDDISPMKHYLAKIYDVWYLGHFSEQWYGWNFDDWGTSGIQLSSIESLYEVDLSALDG